MLLAIAFSVCEDEVELGMDSFACIAPTVKANLYACGGVREGLVGVGIAGGVVAAVGAVVLAAMFGGRRR